MKTIIIAAAALLAVPAVAQDRVDRTPTITAPQAGGGTAVSSKAKETRYCVQGEFTGSRIARKTCHTRDRWLARGYDPLDDLKK